jgi:hypothetical protein
MRKISKVCTTCSKPFEADIREHNRGNAKYCSLSCAAKNQKRLITYDKICINCNKAFVSKCADSKYCHKDCKQKYYRKQQLTKDYSTKSLQRILGNLPCEICGWNECTRDIHHILPISKGGKNTLNNVIVLCPNHHRMAHNNLISEEAVSTAFKFRLSLHPELYLEQDALAGN